MNNTEPKFTCSIPRFLKYLLGSIYEKTEIEPEDAVVLAALDSQEEYLHIEFPSEENKLQKPVCWRINFWRQDIFRKQQLRIKSEVERIERCKIQENAQRIAKKMSALMHLPYEICYPIAYTKIAKPKDIAAAKNWGIILDI